MQLVDFSLASTPIGSGCACAESYIIGVNLRILLMSKQQPTVAQTHISFTTEYISNKFSRVNIIGHRSI